MGYRQRKYWQNSDIILKCLLFIKRHHMLSPPPPLSAYISRLAREYLIVTYLYNNN